VSTPPVAALNWPQWRGPAGQGIFSGNPAPARVVSLGSRGGKTAMPGRLHSAPVVWGNRVFVTTATEGNIVAGHHAPEHTSGGQPFVHPDSIGLARANALSVVALDAGPGAIV